jgi:hypothetical protein
MKLLIITLESPSKATAVESQLPKGALCFRSDVHGSNNFVLQAVVGGGQLFELADKLKKAGAIDVFVAGLSRL